VTKNNGNGIIANHYCDNSYLYTQQYDSAFYPPWDGKMSISFWAE